MDRSGLEGGSWPWSSTTTTTRTRTWLHKAVPAYSRARPKNMANCILSPASDKKKWSAEIESGAAIVASIVKWLRTNCIARHEIGGWETHSVGQSSSPQWIECTINERWDERRASYQLPVCAGNAKPRLLLVCQEIARFHWEQFDNVKCFFMVWIVQNWQEQIGGCLITDLSCVWRIPFHSQAVPDENQPGGMISSFSFSRENEFRSTIYASLFSLPKCLESKFRHLADRRWINSCIPDFVKWDNPLLYAKCMGGRSSPK